MADQCEVCGSTESISGLTLFGMISKPERVNLCGNCSGKVRNRDPERWERIREVLRSRD
jgi:hypothetical protein